MESLPLELNETQKTFESELNKHGFGFQYRVLAEAQKAAKTVSRWRFLGSEVPVETRSQGTRVDFVLEYAVQGSGSHDYLICECKRVNPAFGKWCFVRAPFTRRNNRVESLRMEAMKASLESGVLISHGNESFPLTKGSVFHHGLQVKTPVKGDSQPKGSRDEIEDAISQVLRGMNGYVNFLASNRRLLGEKLTILLPVVFTTAELWASTSDLSQADLETGNIDLSAGEFHEMDWLWFQYNMSPGIKHSHSQPSTSAKFEEIMEEEYVRTVAIVGAKGIDSFLEFTTDNVLR